MLVGQQLQRRFHGEVISAIWDRALKAVHQVRRGEDFPGWLRALAKSTFLNHVEAERRWDRRQAIAADEASSREERRREIEDARAELDVLLRTLPAHDRAFVERWLAGWTHDKLAEMEGYASPNSSALRLHRIKERLRAAARHAR
jgi:DNA-directed RNA polymerase specialized sigma24 family protein